MIPINVIVEILCQALDFTNNVVSKFDDEKYARAVNDIYGYEPNYRELEILTEMIMNDSDISIQKKQELIFAITDKRNELHKKECELKKECAKIVNKGFEKKCKFVMKLALGITTGGLSLIPDLYHIVQNGENNELIIEPKDKNK